MSSQAPEPPPGEDRTREQVQALLDFLLLYETESASDRLRTVEEYQRLFPRIADAVALEHARLSSARTQSGIIDPDKPLPRIAHYILERELGSGGQGRVFLATDSRMRRNVALKVLNRANLTPDKLRRFRREVEVIAKLDHPGLCTVYEADLDAARPYLAMRFVDGADLSRKLTQGREGDAASLIRPGNYASLAQLLHVFERTARALHAAHEAGVVHRDIKPANILVDQNGEPVIVDFGLARGDDSEFANLTRTDDVLGTPAYMAPELLESGHSSADRRVDVYALGVALYECLTLERPFRAEHREALFKSILHGEYKNPRQLNSMVSEDLRVVLATAMEHQAARRYATALEFAEDLRRVREYEPIRARRASWSVRLRRWSQRHPRIAAAVALLLVTLGVWIGTLSYTLGEVEAQSSRARAANGRLLGIEYREKSAAELTTDPGLALVLAIEASRRDPGFESNMAVQHALLRRHEKRTYWIEGARAGGDPDVSRDGKRMVLGTSGCQGFLFDLDSSYVQVRSESQALSASSVQVQTGFSPDGDSFFVRTEATCVQLFDSKTGRLLRSFSEHTKRVTSCEFSPDGRRILTSSLDGKVRVFDVDTGALIQSFESPAGYLSCARFDATGSLILTSTDSRPDAESAAIDNDPRVWDARTGAALATLRGHESPIRAACFSQDGATVFTAEVDGIVRAWDWRTATVRWSVPLPAQAWCLALSADGSRIAAGFERGAVVLFANSGAKAFDMAGLSNRSVIAIGFSPDGRWIAARDYGGNLGAWSVRDGALCFCTCVPGGSVTKVSWLPDSRHFLTAGGGEQAHLWTIDAIPDLVTLESHVGAVRSAVFAPASQSVLSAGVDGVAKISSTETGALQEELAPGAGPLERAWFIEEGRTIAILSQAGELLLVDTATGARRTVRAADGGSVTCSTLSRAGDSVCFGSDDGRVLWLETSSGKPIVSAARRTHPIRTVAISQNDERAAWGAADGWAGVLEQEGGKDFAFDECRNAVYRPQVFTVGFTADGERLLTCGDHLGIHEWNASTGEFLLRSVFRPIGALAAVGNGVDLIVSAHLAPQYFRLDARTDVMTWQKPQPNTDDLITSLRVSRDERFLLSASRGGVAQLSSVASGERILRYEHGTSPLTCAEFSPDSRAVVTAAEDGSVRVWPIDVVGVARACAPSTPDMWPLQIPKGVDEQ